MLTRLFATAALALILASPTFAQTSSDTGATSESAQSEATSEQSQQDAGATAEGEQTPAQGEATTAGATQAEGEGETIISEQGSSEMLAGNLIGLSLTNQKKEEIGSVNDLILDEDGKLSGVVVGVGGFLGIGQKDVGVAWDQISFSPEEDIATVNLSRQQLEQAPDFKSLADVQAEQAQGQGTGTTATQPVPESTQ